MTYADITSVEAVLGEAPDITATKDSIIKTFLDVFEMVPAT
jgi:hypothetical protein